MTDFPITIAALYRFARFEDPAALRGPVLEKCDALGIKGTLLLAKEGINGTIAGGENAIAAIIAFLRTLPDCAALGVKYSYAQDMPFHRMKVRLKKEIVTMGIEGIDPNHIVGTYVQPAEWNALISDPDTVLIDTRNDYEVQIGTFKGAIDPETKTFREFPDWFRANRDALLQGKTKVAMFCTGGIRCEKSTAFLKEEGISEVYHLDGGILRYLEEVEATNSLWDGECFVFDERVSVGHGLVPGPYDMCRACRRPLSADDKASARYEDGVSCPACFDERTEDDRRRYAERQKQVALAEKRGQAHIGADPRSS